MKRRASNARDATEAPQEELDLDASFVQPLDVDPKAIGEADFVELTDVDIAPVEQVSERLEATSILGLPSEWEEELEVPKNAARAHTEPLEASEDSPEDATDAEPAPTGEWRSYRQIFETTLHPLSRDDRARLALNADEPALSAFCFDPDPVVIYSVLENALTGLAQARLIAAFHHNAAGLRALARRRDLLADTQVQRLLLRNQQLPDTVFQMFMARKPMLSLFQTVCNRDVSERSRTSARLLLRRKFKQQSTPEARVNLIFATHGRVLPSLAGMIFDGQTIRGLTSRTYTSSLLIQNLARFATTPAPILIHLLRQPLTRTQSHLIKLLLRHPNLPPGAKQQLSGGFRR